MDNEMFEKVRKCYAKLMFSKTIEELRDHRNALVNLIAMTAEQRKTIIDDLLEIESYRKGISNFSLIDFKGVNDKFDDVVKGYYL